VGDHGAGQLSPLFGRRLIRPDGHGGYLLDLDPEERDLLRNVAPQFIELLDDPSQPVLERLFPPAYSNPAHLEMQDEFRRLMQEDLVERHRVELEMLATTASSETLTEEQLLAWSRALNSVRLILGTYLGVTDDDEAGRAVSSEDALYQWLTHLLGEAIEALSGQT
jgi:Domain of unknown function (DUF2017)